MTEKVLLLLSMIVGGVFGFFITSILIILGYTRRIFKFFDWVERTLISKHG